MSKIVYPTCIKKGATFGITATSDGLANEIYSNRLDNAIKNVRNLGYNVVETNNVRTRSKLVSSDAKVRAMEFLSLWEDEQISVIGQLFGGEFLLEMLPYIDKNIIQKNNPKWVFGYSDSSLLNFFLTTNFNIATLTCDNFISYGMDVIHDSLFNILYCLENDKELTQESFELYEKEKLPRDKRVYNGTYNLTEKVLYKNLYDTKSEAFSGRIIGGCIDALACILGTPYDNTKAFCKQFDGMLWYLENCELTLPSLYRALWQMKEAGWFVNAKAFIIGRTRAQVDIEDFTYLDVLHKIFDDLKVPVIYDVDTGHVSPQWTMINGSYAYFEYENGKGKLIQERK